MPMRFCQWRRRTASPDTTIRKDNKFVPILTTLLSKRKTARHFYHFIHKGRGMSMAFRTEQEHIRRDKYGIDVSGKYWEKRFV